MGQFGRLTSAADLPPEATLHALVRQARAVARRNGLRAEEAAKPALATPKTSLPRRGNATARATFEAFPPSCRRDYFEWVVEAKRLETRAKRIAQAVEWGGRQAPHWKYENC